jgi:hypothetical protein
VLSVQRERDDVLKCVLCLQLGTHVLAVLFVTKDRYQEKWGSIVREVMAPDHGSKLIHSTDQSVLKLIEQAQRS